MAETILETVSFRRMPWKNGGGFTTEIAAERAPDSSDMDFAWRLSIAEIRNSGPFSRFPGSDRLIMQLSGETIELSHPGIPRPTVRLEPFRPYAFAGEWDTIAALKPDANEHGQHTISYDFNLIVRREYAFGALAVFSPAELRAGQFCLKLLGNRTAADLRVLLYAYKGDAKIGDLTLPEGCAYLWSGNETPLLPNLEIPDSACIITALIGYWKSSKPETP